MKNIARLLVIFLLLITITGSSEQFVDFDKSKCRRKCLSTAEEGTCFHPDAYRLLRTIQKIRDNPILFENNKQLFTLFEPRVHCVKDTVIRKENLTVPLRIYYPDKECQTEAYPVIFYIHGGAFMYGSVADYDMLAKKIARATRSIVTSVEYRLAPDHPFPAAIDDSYCALQWVSDHMEELGGIEDGLFIMGSSAGANIATVLCLLSHEREKPKLSGQILYYPVTTFCDISFPSRTLFLKDTTRYYFLTDSLVRKCKNCYMGTFTDDRDPRLSPLGAELHPDLPAALIFTAQCDPLRDEGNLYAQKLRENGIEVQNIEYKGMIHGFLSFYMVLNDGKKSLKVSRDFVHDHLPESITPLLLSSKN